MVEHPKRSGAAPSPLTWAAVWLARCFLLAGTVGLPLLLAVSTWDDAKAWPWVHYVMPSLFVACAVVGCVYTLRRWADPPTWAWILSRSLPYRDEWHQR